MDGLNVAIRGANIAASEDASELIPYVSATPPQSDGRAVSGELTSLVQALRPAALEEKGLVAAVRELALQWSLQSGIATHVRVQGEPSPSVMVGETLYRIVQEALANVARHSQATSVEITLMSEQDTFMLRVDDNGQGFDQATAQVESAPGKGTCITACCSDLEPKEREKEFARWSRSRF